MFRKCIIEKPASVHQFSLKLCISDFVHVCVSTTGNRIGNNPEADFLTERACKCLQTSFFNNCCNPLILTSATPSSLLSQSWQKFGTSPVGMSWDRKLMIPTQSQLFDIPSPDQPPLSF